MEQNEYDEKLHELEKALVERRAELGRSKTSEAEEEKLLIVQKEVENLLNEAKLPNNEETKREIIRRANEMLLELRLHPLG